MNPTATLSQMRQIFNPTPRGVVGLVDDLLALCPETGLELTWRDERCQLDYPSNPGEESFDVPLPKSVFRALLARIATLCNEYEPNSVSPYGGQGKLRVGTNLGALLQVTFVNTPAEQKLALVRTQ